MNPWVLIGILGWTMNDRSREAVELRSLRNSVDNLQHQLAAAIAKNAMGTPPQQEPESCWAEPAEQPTESSAEVDFYPGDFLQSIIDGEADYLWRMTDRTVEDYCPE